MEQTTVNKKNLKTILIPIFQGIEARNILRTDIYRRLVEQKSIKIILLFSSKQKSDYYSEFRRENVALELFDNYKPSLLDGLFISKFKFYFLKTKTTDLKRSLSFKKNRNIFYFFIGSALNFILANKIFVKIFRVLDYYCIGNAEIARLYEKYRPDVVLLAHLFSDDEAAFLREAKRKNIKIAGLINSWDKLTARCILRTLPDWLIVPNNINKNEAIKYHYVPENKIFVSGPPQFDIYREIKATSKEDFFIKSGIDLDKKILLFCPQGKDFYEDDWDIIRLLDEFVKNGNFSEKIHVIVRFPPNDLPYMGKDIDFSNFTFQHPGKRFTSKRGVDWDMDDKDLDSLVNTIKHSSVVIVFASTISIDAVLLDKPIINIGFGEDKLGRFYPSPKYFFELEHYQNIVKGGGIRLVKNKEELLNWINAYIKNPEIDKEGRNKIVEEQLVFSDGKSGLRIANFIIDKLFLK